MYKDPDKQREAVKRATQRYRAKKADSALSGQKQVSQNARGLPEVGEVGDTQPVIPSKVIPKCDTRVIPKRTNLVRPEGISDSQWAYIKMRAEQ